MGVRSQEVAALSADTVGRDKTMRLGLPHGSEEERANNSLGLGVPRVFFNTVCVCVFQHVDEAEAVDMKVDDSQVWVPAEEPIINSAFLFDSKIWEICQELPIHWIHPSLPSGESRGRLCL